MSISNQQVIKDFRKILCHFRKLPSFQRNSSQSPTSLASGVGSASYMRNYLLKQYHIGRKETDPERAQHLRKSANAYATMVEDIETLRKLRWLDSGERLDPREKIQATAKRVGLVVPEYGL